MASSDVLPFPEELIQALRQSSKVTVLTGAGISAESGIPTFRDAQTGLWANYNPQELASPQGFKKNPQLVWEWYASRRDLIKQVHPNPGHFALVAMQKHFRHFSLITQNIDTLHQRAGSHNVIELHGNIHRIRCSNDARIIEKWSESSSIPPLCPQCGSFLRPDVVWFGEPLPQAAIDAAWHASENCAIFFSIGTSSLVNPAASLPYLAAHKNALLVEINTQHTPLTPDVSYFLQGPSGSILPGLLQAVWNETLAG